MTFIDDFFRYVHAVTNEKTYDVLNEFEERSEVLLERKIKEFETDKGKENIGNNVQNYYLEKIKTHKEI